MNLGDNFECCGAGQRDPPIVPVGVDFYGRSAGEVVEMLAADRAVDCVADRNCGGADRVCHHNVQVVVRQIAGRDGDFLADRARGRADGDDNI